MLPALFWSPMYIVLEIVGLIVLSNNQATDDKDQTSDNYEIHLNYFSENLQIFLSVLSIGS